MGYRSGIFVENRLEKQFWMYAPNLAKNREKSKIEKVNITIEFSIFELV